MTNNYFYCGKEAFFFNDKDMRSTSFAFRLALDRQIDMPPSLKTSKKISVYKRPEVRGAWDDLARVVGEDSPRENN